jgi:hypothetical protein
MFKVWFKFVLWTIVVGIILRFIITRLTGQPFCGLMATLYGGVEYLFLLIQLLISGVVIGSIIFAIWYAIAGRKHK